MGAYNIYLTGVGGQGIGLLSETLLRAADHAGIPAKGVDTHGLAQRGGIVVSHLRLGSSVHSPLISERSADMVIALERNEAMRALNGYLKDGGTLVYYDTVWQPLPVRLGQGKDVTVEAIDQECHRRQIRKFRVKHPDLADARMQNMVLLACVCQQALIPGLEMSHYTQAMADLMAGPMLETNLNLFQAQVASV